MNARLLHLGLLSWSLVITGCGRKSAPPPEPAPQKEAPSGSVEKLLSDSSAAPAPPPSAAPIPGTPSAQPETPVPGGADPASSSDPLKILNAAIDYYVLRENRPPKTMQDLLEGGNLKVVPSAPPGMKYVIDRPTLKAKLVKQ